MGKFLFQEEEAKIRAQERERANRRVAAVEEKRKKEASTYKAASETHRQELAEAKTVARIAIQREAAAKVQLEKEREENAALLLRLKRVEKLNQGVVDALAGVIREDGLSVDRACKKIGLKFSLFEYWYAQGASDNAEPIYLYLRQEVDEAIADDEAKWRKKLEDLSVDVFEDIVNKDGDVVGRRLARRASDKAVTFALERRHPAYAPKTVESLPAEKTIEADLSRLSPEAFAAYREAEETVLRLKKEAESLKQRSLVSDSNKVVDTEGEDVPKSEP